MRRKLTKAQKNDPFRVKRPYKRRAPVPVSERIAKATSSAATSSADLRNEIEENAQADVTGLSEEQKAAVPTLVAFLDSIQGPVNLVEETLTEAKQLLEAKRLVELLEAAKLASDLEEWGLVSVFKGAVKTAVGIEPVKPLINPVPAVAPQGYDFKPPEYLAQQHVAQNSNAQQSGANPETD